MTAMAAQPSALHHIGAEGEPQFQRWGEAAEEIDLTDRSD